MVYKATVTKDFLYQFVDEDSEVVEFNFYQGDELDILAEVVDQECDSGKGYVALFKHKRHGYQAFIVDSTLVTFHPPVLPVFD